MNRRHFFALSALAKLAPSSFSDLLLADGTTGAARPGSSLRNQLSLHPLLNRFLATPPVGIPTVTPTFAAMFGPGSGGIQMVLSESWADFSTQVQTQSGNGYTLSAMTSIQNLNRTFFYGAFQKGTGAYSLFRTSDPNAFQQTFTQNQSGYTLVDFNVAWELGQIYYSGYWLATAQPAGQTLLLDLPYSTLGTDWTNLSSNQGMRMTRVQAYPNNSSSLFAALFAPGTDSYTFYDEPAAGFFTDVAGRFSGNSLVGMDFDPTSGNMIGCWRKKVTPSQFVSGEDWPTLMATAQQASASGMVLTAMTAYPNAPDFDDYFEANLAPFVEGYAYAVAKGGQVIATGNGYARSSYEAQNPSLPFTADSRMNIASVSKAITGIALEALCLQKNISLDAPFWPLIQSQVPNPDPSVRTVTLRNLAEMKSGMTQEAGEGPLNPPSGFSDIWGWLNSYLANPLVATPGVTYFYDNTNFTILQAVIQLQSGMNYTDFVSQYVLVPSGVNTAVFNATPDAAKAATLQYSGPTDTRPGNYWAPLTFVAPGGWISSSRELIKVLMAMRGTSVLPAATVTEMFNDLIGFDSAITGNFGTYYAKNGGLSNALTPAQQLNTAFVRLGEGYDIVLLANSHAPLDVVTICVGAFDSRGLPLSSLPDPNAPALTAISQSATFQANCAPGCYASVIATGLPGPELVWDNLISSSGALPVELNGVQVRVGSQNAYLSYAGPTQINFLIPSTVPPGLTNVEVTTPLGGMTSSVQLNPVAPGLFAYTLNGILYPAAQIAGTTTLVAATGAFGSGAPSRPATAGDFVQLYGNGMGPTNPAAPDGTLFPGYFPPAAGLSAFKATIGGVAVTVTFAGLIAPGLWQINLQIPTGVPTGDQTLNLTVSGVAVQPNLKLTMG